MVKASKAAAPEEPKLPVLNESGEMLLYLEGVPYVLRPGRKANTAIERQLRPLTQLAYDAERQALSLEDMAVITAEYMRAYAEANPKERGVIVKPTLETLQDHIQEAGIIKVCARLMVVLNGAVTGGYTASGEPKAGTNQTA
jgi:hypothetical protein